MGFWKEWLQTLLALAVLIGLAEMLLPPGDLGRFSKLVLGLVLMLAVLQPLLLLFDRGWEGLELGWQENFPGEPAWQALAARIQAAGEEPFLQDVDQGLARKIESLLLTLNEVEEARVSVESASGGIRRVLVGLDTSDGQVKNKVRKIVAGFLNLQEELVLVQDLGN